MWGLNLPLLGDVSGGPPLVEQIGPVQIANNSATIDFIWTKEYRMVSFILSSIVPITDGAQLRGRTSGDGGATWDAGASDYDYANAVLGSVAGGLISVASDYIALTQINTTSGLGNGVDEQAGLVIDLIAPSVASNTHLSVRGGSRRASGQAFAIYGWGQRKSAAKANGLRFLLDTGNISSGEFAAYGLR